MGKRDIEVGFCWVAKTAFGFSTQQNATGFVNAWAALRLLIVRPQQAVATAALLAAFAALLVQLRRFSGEGTQARSPFGTALIVYGLYSLLCFAILSYVAVFKVEFDPRMMLSTYTVGVVGALPFVYEGLFWRRRHA